MSSGRLDIRVRRGVNVVVWTVREKGSTYYFMWSPGGRLKFSLTDPAKAGSSMPSAIRDPSADGNYRTEKEARAAIGRFLHG